MLTKEQIDAIQSRATSEARKRKFAAYAAAHPDLMRYWRALMEGDDEKLRQMVDYEVIPISSSQGMR